MNAKVAVQLFHAGLVGTLFRSGDHNNLIGAFDLVVPDAFDPVDEAVVAKAHLVESPRKATFVPLEWNILEGDELQFPSYDSKKGGFYL